MTDTKTKSVPKLSVKPPGYWRNKVWADFWVDGTRGVKYGPNRWPSREVAEEKAAEVFRDEGILPTTKYLGAEFFPEDAA